MSSAANFYSAEAAFPSLAHSLLSPPTSSFKSQNQHSEVKSAPTPPPDKQEKQEPESWSLKSDIETGFKSSSDTIFHSGIIVGLSKLRSNNRADDDHEYIGQFPRYLLTTHIRQTSSSSQSKPNTFIIHPTNFKAFSPQKLLASLLSPAKQPSLSREEAIKRLDSVQLLPVFDFAGAVQAISEISDTLHKTTEERTSQCPIILAIAGLDTLAEAVIRASNPVRGTAVLTAALRTLTQLTRMHSSFLSVMLVNTSGLGTVPQDSHDNSARNSGGQVEDPKIQAHGSQQMREDGIHSIFRVTGTSLFPSLLMRTLDQGIDTHILLSSVRGAQVVEVIKDRTGDEVGKWCIWKKDLVKSQ